MLVFVVPLKSSKISKSWDQVCKLFERCVKSVCNQTSSDFRVIVVCNEKPQTQFEHAHLQYVEVDFPVPDKNISAMTLDRGRKVLLGLQMAQEFNPSHAMVVDADDCVSKYLAEFVNQNTQHNGWYVNKGYIYKDGSRFVYLKKKNFNHICGTCNIIRYDLYDLFENLEDKYSDLILKYHGGHKYILETLIHKGVWIEPLPFAGAAYIVENGENYYNDRFESVMPKEVVNRIKTTRHFRLLNNLLRDEFGLYEIANPEYRSVSQRTNSPQVYVKSEM